MKLLSLICLRLLTKRINCSDTVYHRHFGTIVQSEWEKPNDGFDTGITIYNCVHRDNVPFIVRNTNCVTWYTCGPTVYDEAHMGHAVCYMKCDIIQRILRNHFHLNLVTAMNITDIDDKIIARSASLNVSAKELTAKYEHNFWHDINALGIQRADIIIRVTEFMPKIIAFIEKLLAKGAAYVASDGSVYFANPRTNGKLQNLPSATEQPTQNVSSSVRKSVQDYALWKSSKSSEPHWDVPWKYEDDQNVSTVGRPGWHSECAAIATELFGNTVDVHAGGIDLRFPHHENEESQCCAYHNQKQWVNYWLHIGHLVTTDNVKMSKSLKNFVTVKEFLKHYSSDQFRIVCLMSTYHTHVEFSDDTLLDAGNILKRLFSFFQDTERFINHASEQKYSIPNRDEILTLIQLTQTKIEVSLKQDFDTRSCVMALMHLVGIINKAINPTQQELANVASKTEHGNGLAIIKCGQTVVRNFFEMVGCQSIFTNTFEHGNAANTKTVENATANQFVMENLINDIMKYRTDLLDDAKENKDKKLFEICDRLRSIYRKNGLIVKDHGTNSSWYFDTVVTRKNRSTE